MDETVVSVIIVILIVAILIYYASTFTGDSYLTRERRRRYNQIKEDVVYIKSIHERISGSGKKISIFEKGTVKKKFETSHNAVRQYVEFCESKALELTEKEKELISVIHETEDALDPAGALNREMERANAEYNKAYTAVNTSGEWLLHAREDSADTICQIEELINSIARHPKEFDRDVKVISVNRTEFTDALQFGKQQEKALKMSAEGAGAGVAAGTAVASLAPSAAMWVATTFGTASTGTAISALSGAAAQNAALAWLGGGALTTATGGGMAAGQALLALAGPVGWGVAGGSVLVSALFLWRKHMRIEENKKQEIVRIKNCTASLKTLKADMDNLAIQTESLNQQLAGQLHECDAVYESDYTALSDEQKKKLTSLVNNTKTLSELLSKVLADEESNDKDKKSGKNSKEHTGTGGGFLDKLFKSAETE